MKKFLFIIQTLLTLACLVLVIIYFIGSNKTILTALEITTGVDLVFMGINNYIIRKNIKVSLLYWIVGVIMISIVVLSKLGVI